MIKDPPTAYVWPSISARQRRILARASTMATSKFTSVKMRQRHPLAPITLRRSAKDEADGE